MTKVDLTNTARAAVSGSATNGLRDIKPPVEIPSGWLWLGWIAGAILLAGLAWLAWRYWQRKKMEVPVVPPVPAHVLAKQRLTEALALIGQPKEFCIAVSDALRWYLEERFDFHAPERTTEEFLNELRDTDLLTRDQKESLVEFLNRCDLVKFARYEPVQAELRDLHACAVRLVEETEPPPPAEGGTSNDTVPSSDPGAAQPAIK
ncbi:MAG TPA: hypothetical protein VKY92_12430 [Verrucomicrobiae bacterium]|nr:hypothetical protein [Verrucomicrobiae bacterium]